MFCSIQNWLNINFVFFMFIFRPTLLLSVLRSLSISSSLWPSSAIRMMSSANRRWFNLLPSMFIPLLSQLILRNIASSAALKSLGEIESPCRTPLLTGNAYLYAGGWSQLPYYTSSLWVWRICSGHPVVEGLLSLPAFQCCQRLVRNPQKQPTGAVCIHRFSQSTG